MLLAIVLLLAYLAGSVPTGVLVTRAFGGGDPRAACSGNIGATNVLRTAGTRAGALTLAGDMAKGALPALLAISLDLGPSGAGAVVVAAVIGHVLPVTLGFRGGKGVATACGGFLVVAPAAALFALGIYAVALALTRTSSVGSLAASLALLPALWGLGAEPGVLLAATAAVLLILGRHRDNIRRLIQRRELRVHP
jgi:glycerol-3-phosphate acyltransferase PlsY